ncbi:hypothetical protein [Stenotrophomonas sp. CFBP 13718]|uniref:hypothetical protein n=1 Tax=Stenotrophomonas sp. CFBP 13718 TaxID=2775304 RepID=UPI00177B688F|nr:hypothetical protein [Stenotrophomonas sp. CFBP 13718]MBD8696638.1 hypothetical protein [Stenotrophomonas sp. CFBP 13718]
MLKVSGANYYDSLPPAQFDVGDIWEGLPAFGHLGLVALKGLVITPACDLANRKVETLTYLPIVNLSDYLVGRAFSVEVLRVLKAQVKSLGLDPSAFDGLRGVSLPPIEALKVLHRSATDELSTCKSVKNAQCYKRVIGAINHIISIRKRCDDRTVQELREILGVKDFDRAVREIVRNAYSNDLHFLPSDGRIAETSVINEHCVALFRYAMSIPVELLELAQEPNYRDWPAAVAGMAGEFPLVVHAPIRPMRIGRLKALFVPDLVSRFTSLHVRMGSPDFSSETVSEYSTQIGAYK